MVWMAAMAKKKREKERKKKGKSIEGTFIADKTQAC